MKEKSESFVNLFRNYEVFLNDGSLVELKRVAISTQKNGAKTAFYTENGNTIFVVSDNAMKYIVMTE